MTDQIVKEVDLVEVVAIIWNKKIYIAAFSLVIAVICALYSLSLSNEYRSQIVLQPVKSDNAMGGMQNMLSQFGGLASLAGINLPSSEDQSELAMEIVQSRAFVLELVRDNNLLIPLMAADGWDTGSDKLTYDPEVYDQQTQKWMLEAKDGSLRAPNDQEVIDRFAEIFSVAKTLDTGLVTFSLQFYSPAVAKQWLELIVDKINKHMRKKSQLQAETKINYLTQKIQDTEVATIRSIFYQLIENEYQMKMLADTREEFIFKVVDPAYVPDLKAAPLRGLYTIFAFILAFILSSTFFVVKQAVRNR